MNKQILLSLGTLVVAGAVIVGGTGAFFSDTETSTGNVFTAGSVTLLVNNITHTYNGDAGNAPVFTEDSVSFELDDLKPLDAGSIDYQVLNGQNEAYICAMVTETANADNSLVDPESDLGDDATEGELQDFLSFKFGTFSGKLADISGLWQEVGVVNAQTPTNSVIEYCFGDYDGTSCILSGDDDNLAQTDSVTADIEFYAVQTRNNEDFTCASLNDDLTVRPAVGAFAFAYAEPEPASCDLTVDGVGTGANEYLTLAAAEAAATADQTICVAEGLYEEDVTIDVSGLTVLGLNDPKGASKATIDGLLTVDANGVTISGLEMTNPDAPSVVLVRDVDNTEISNNSVVNVGTTVATGGVQAIYFVGNTGTAGSAGLTITGNTIDGVGNTSLSLSTNGSSAKGIYIGDSNDTGVVTDVVITNNMISDVKASNDTFGNGGRGAYGILLNYGVNGSVGSVDGAVIMNNTISDVAGWWARGVGLETNTPNTSVTKNDISDVVSPVGASDGVHFEGNLGGSTTVVNENNFASTVVYGVAIHPSNPAILVDAEDNWWGDITPADDVNENAGTIDFDPFEASAFPTN